MFMMSDHLKVITSFNSSQKSVTIEIQPKECIMALSEQAISFLEEHIPELADAAFKQAYWAALASGSSVLVSENGDLVEVFPDGKRKFIKKLPPSIPVTRGQRIQSK